MLRHSDCPSEVHDTIAHVIRCLGDIQRIDPSPAILREYSQARHVERMGEHGENFAALVNTIVQDEQARAAYLSWLEQLTPAEIDDVAILTGALGEPLFAVRERGSTFPAPILSDGTLRFAAIAAAFFQPDMPDVLTIEEIENAVHPSRLRLLVELLKSQAQRGRQVMATTHSPVVLAWLKEEDYHTTFFCKRDEETGASQITPLAQVPRLLETARKHSLADLFAEGWLEGAS
jgi:predicted ATPase